MPQARRTREQSQEIFRQEADALGRTRLDRPHTGEEAAAQDAANRERYLAERAKRFAKGGLQTG
jgi:hypothetical protein